MVKHILGEKHDATAMHGMRRSIGGYSFDNKGIHIFGM
jgi:hypothetical protein